MTSFFSGPFLEVLCTIAAAVDFELSYSTWGHGELTAESRQPFDPVALAPEVLKQKKAAGVGSDDLYQFKYTPEDSNL